MAGNHTNVFIIGVHGPHGELRVDTFADIAFLLRQRPWGSKVLVAGDWNVDQLPTLAIDPYADHAERAVHHMAERLLVQSLADRFRLEVNISGMVCSTPGGPFDDVCFMAPVTRIPTGQPASYSLPSLLDYGLSTDGYVKETRVHWEGVPADHAMVTFSTHSATSLQRNRKTTWKCRDEEQCIAWIVDNSPDSFPDLQTFHAFALRMQAEWADAQTCRQRREQRLPSDLRSAYDSLANAKTEFDRGRLQGSVENAL